MAKMFEAGRVYKTYYSHKLEFRYILVEMAEDFLGSQKVTFTELDSGRVFENYLLDAGIWSEVEGNGEMRT